MKVFVLDKNKAPLMPTSAVRARKLLKSGRAVVACRQPFTIRLKDRKAKDSQFQPVRIKFDPGSKTTDVALAREADDNTNEVLHLAELHHKATLTVSKKMQGRAARRRRRRSANIRYRKPRWNNRTRMKGWLPPSLRARVDNVASWTDKYQRLVPISSISVETVRFDMQKMQHPEIDGVGYQQGELAGYEVKEYLLEKWGRKCAYCGAENVPLEVEHIHPKSRGGSNRVSNLTIACQSCNLKKSNHSIEKFLENKPVRLKKIMAQIKTPLKDAAAVNITRWVIYEMLMATGLAVEMGSGGLTKFNRSQHGLPKTHAYDALCVGKSTPKNVLNADSPVLEISAVGRGKYKRMNSDSFGFPKGVHQKGRSPRWRKPDGSPVGHTPRQKTVNGIKTNDFVKVVFPVNSRGKHAGSTHYGYVTVRFGGSFYIKTPNGSINGSPKYFVLVDRSAGYTFKIDCESQERQFVWEPENYATPDGYEAC